MSVIQYRPGKWKVELTRAGKRYYQAGFTSKNLAERKEEEIRNSLSSLNQSLSNLFLARLRELKGKRTEKHFKENAVMLKDLLLRWGNNPVVTKADVTEYLDFIASTISRHAANKRLRLIKAVFNFGISEGMINYNPCIGVKLYPVCKESKYIPPVADVKKVLGVAKPEDRNYLLAVIHTIGRIREINSLKWNDIRGKYLILRTKKAKNSDVKERLVFINDVLKRVLEEVPHQGEYVFTNTRTNTKYDYRKKLMKRLCDKAEVPYFSFHALRHLGASFLVDAGKSLVEVQEALGHERATTTDVYLHRLGLKVAETTMVLNEIY